MFGRSDFSIAANIHHKNGFSWFESNHHRLRMNLIMLCADLFGFGAAGAILYAVNLWLTVFVFQTSDLRYFMIVILCLALYLPTKLYWDGGLNPAEEIRLVVVNTSIGFLTGVFFLGAVQGHWHPNYLALLPFGFLIMVMVLAMRWGFRILSVQSGLWGAPVVVVGAGRDANKLARYFLSRRRLGFVPRYVVTEVKGDRDVTAPVSILDRNEILKCPDDYFSSRQIYTALIDITETPEMFYSPIFSRLPELFPHLILISNLGGLDSASLQVHDFEGIVGVEASKNVLSPFDSFIKRSMDILLSLFLIVVSLPLWLLTMLLIRLDSPGPIFFTQERVGQNRHDRHNKEPLMNHARTIRVYKFRTMVIHAEQKLEECLNANPQARAEWEHSQKLKHDPRITRVGKWIRAFSIDELPQLINVFKGEMSLVGPRPLPHYHQDLLSEAGKELRSSVSPGLTGMWQVSGRSNTTISEMEAFDAYYIHNWSVWLDLYILLRTVWVVLTKDGAY